MLVDLICMFGMLQRMCFDLVLFVQSWGEDWVCLVGNYDNIVFYFIIGNFGWLK